VHRRLIVAIACAIALAASLVVAQPSVATYPGGDGKIAFVRSNQIYVINADGSGLKQLTTGAKNYRPKWSPDGSRIAYIHEVAGGYKDVYVMAANGAGKTSLTQLGNVRTEPTWSPDGSWIAFGAGITTYASELMRVRSQIGMGLPQVLGGYYTSCEGCGDAGDPTDAIAVDRFLAWSPDGNTIAVYNHWDGSVDDTIYMYDVATGEARQYRGVGADCCGYEDWSDLVWGPAGQFGYADIVYDETGSNPAPSKIIYPGYVGKPGDTGPAPAPGNRRIAVTNAASGTARIFIQAIGGANRRQLTSGYQPDWQPRP
jgi:Tol biopolymer transport system component